MDPEVVTAPETAAAGPGVRHAHAAPTGPNATCASRPEARSTRYHRLPSSSSSRGQKCCGRPRLERRATGLVPGRRCGLSSRSSQLVSRFEVSWVVTPVRGVDQQTARERVPIPGGSQTGSWMVVSAGSSVRSVSSGMPRSRMRARTPCSCAWSMSGPVRLVVPSLEAGQGEVVERGGPVIVEVARDPDLVGRGAGRGRACRSGRLSWGGAGHVGAPPCSCAVACGRAAGVAAGAPVIGAADGPLGDGEVDDPPAPVASSIRSSPVPTTAPASLR